MEDSALSKHTLTAMLLEPVLLALLVFCGWYRIHKTLVNFVEANLESLYQVSQSGKIEQGQYLKDLVVYVDAACYLAGVRSPPQ